VSLHWPDRALPITISRVHVLAREQAWLAAGWLATVAPDPAMAANPYSYAKFSLEVPWTLYFVFLSLISLPFAVMILLAWRRGRSEEESRTPDTGSQPGPQSLTEHERSS